MKRNTTENTYRKNNRQGAVNHTTADNHLADVVHTTVDNHTADVEHMADVEHTVDDWNIRHNRQGAVATDDTEGVSTASGISSAVTTERQMGQADLYDNRPLAFTLKNMTDLVIAYEAYRKLEQSVMLLTDTIPDNPILAGLRHIDEIIFDISPVFDDMDEDVEYDTFVKILDDLTMGAEEKAEILMCWSSAGGSSSTVDKHRVDSEEPEDQDGTDDMEDQDNEENNDTSIPFTLEHMELLLTAYDGYRELQDGLMDLLKMDPEEGVFHSISQLDNLICKLSPIYDRTKNYQDQELGKVLLDDSSPLHVRAEKLMGW